MVKSRARKATKRPARSALALCGLLLVTLGAGGQPAPECAMSLAFHQRDDDAPGGRTPVWADASGSALLFIEKLNINTDGTRRSYRVGDFWGQTNALNNLCNAMNDACAGLDQEGLKARRVLTQKAAAGNWPQDLLAQTRISPSIIPFRNGKPCPAVDGYLVSATALHKPGIPDACDISNYVDALVTPAIVIPKKPSVGTSAFADRNARVGDLVVAMRPEGADPVFAVVGDTGPSNKLGEGSVALNGQLLKRTTAPVNYLELRGKPPFQGKGWSVPRTAVLIFTGTRDTANPYMAPDRINTAAGEKFNAWGGVPRLQACMRAMGA
jgi:hypothetical protein